MGLEFQATQSVYRQARCDHQRQGVKNRSHPVMTPEFRPAVKSVGQDLLPNPFCGSSDRSSRVVVALAMIPMRGTEPARGIARRSEDRRDRMKQLALAFAGFL